ncbi:acyl-CoA dehydrogenase family protein [Thermocoleostomius sinensis]|uniref:Acyl-CoA/acyl-ACP dehydrogenase n=1 Tax=Thermocoleostomius sinensis A174 TaxID=2016057 RepID=A0A9E9C6I4_9CYAN|nr:acyl-CoA dehydrogenase family protein [Thermocoleostomius sinensis]WAL58218.1 acyl-CoA/acyl-ACP dehydrogenase [Thermocoleostomius sinensis A174]
MTSTTISSSPRLPNQPSPLSIPEVLDRASEIADFCATNAAAIDYNGAFPVQEFELIAKAGLLAAPLQPELGGLGLGIQANVTWELLLLLKHIGRGNLAVGRIYEGHVNALQIIQTFGTPEQINTYAADARDRHRIFGVWNAEAEDGVKVYPLSNGRYRLAGSKTFCSGCGFVDRPFVNGALPDGSWQMCIVPMEDVVTVSDPTWWQPSGMRATASFKVDFSGVELKSSALIGQPGDYFRQPWLTAGVIRFAAVQLGGAEALFNATRQYLQALNRTSDAYQQERLGRMAIAIESGNLWLRGAADLVQGYHTLFAGDPHQPSDSADQASQLVAYANMVRTAIEQICMDVIQLCQRSVGTRGLLPPHPMERIIRDLSLYLRQPVFDASLAAVGQYALSQPKPADVLWFQRSP